MLDFRFLNFVHLAAQVFRTEELDELAQQDGDAAEAEKGEADGNRGLDRPAIAEAVAEAETSLVAKERSVKLMPYHTTMAQKGSRNSRQPTTSIHHWVRSLSFSRTRSMRTWASFR